MVTVGILAALAGYTLAYYGFNTITGGNDSFKSIFWPGAYQYTARDVGSTSTPTKGTLNTPSVKAKQTTVTSPPYVPTPIPTPPGGYAKKTT